MSITEEEVEAAARSHSERIRPGTWDAEPESYRNWWRDEARLNLHLEEMIGTRLETSIERYLARPILTNQEESE